MTHSIIPWKCHTCGRQFDIMAGGLCKGCGKPTCAFCFGLAKLRTLAQFKLPKAGVCRDCAK